MAAVLEIGGCWLQQIIWVHFIGDFLVTLFFLLVLIVDFGFNIDEHIALDLPSSFVWALLP
jgi:hypothetical protein